MNPDIKTSIKWGLGVAALIAVVILASNVFATVEADRFHVKQAWITGKMSARLQPGMYGQWFGTVWTFPKSETFYFIKNERDVKDVDQSVHVRFDDGSPADVSGTIRVNLNVSVDQAIDLVKAHRLTNWIDVETKLVLPTIRRTLILTATTMNATESYQNRRDDFINMVTDQLDNGFYETEDKVTEVTDPLTGEITERSISRVALDDNGQPRRMDLVKDSLGNEVPIWVAMGITFTYFDLKNIVYSETVMKQISAQQELITAEAEGKSKVMTAKYEEEEKKARAVVEAEQRKQVATLDLDTAKLKREADIAAGEGEGIKRQKIMAADGGLEKKLATYEAINRYWAEAFSKRPVPTWISGGYDPNGGDIGFGEYLQMGLAKQLGLDLTIPHGAVVKDDPQKVEAGQAIPHS